jgi:hypothetical protein
MARYRKKPIEVEAIQLREHGSDQWDEVAAFLGLDPNSGRGEHATMRRPRRYEPGFVTVDLHTLEGVMRAATPDWIIRGVEGEFYPCKPSIFDATYEPARDTGDTPEVRLLRGEVGELVYLDDSDIVAMVPAAEVEALRSIILRERDGWTAFDGDDEEPWLWRRGLTDNRCTPAEIAALDSLREQATRPAPPESGGSPLSATATPE